MSLKDIQKSKSRDIWHLRLAFLWFVEISLTPMLNRSAELLQLKKSRLID